MEHSTEVNQRLIKRYWWSVNESLFEMQKKKLILNANLETVKGKYIIEPNSIHSHSLQ